MRLTRWQRWLALALVCCWVTIGAIACGGDPANPPLRVASKDFAEQFILGELYAQTLENAGIPVERKLNLGGTPVAQAGLLAGEIDLYPEYTGTGLLTVLKLPAEGDRQQVYQTVAQAYQERFDLRWLAPSPMSNSNALVTTPEIAERLGIRTITDLVKTAVNVDVIGTPEFQIREDGIPGLRKVYGEFEFKSYKAVDPGLRYPALTSSNADVALGFTTDGEISALGLIVLEDNLQFFPPYQVAPVVRPEAIARYPEIVELLDNVTVKLTDAKMQAMNFAVTGDKQEPAAVARDFLEREGLLAE
ncbi:MAG: glycine betaine ABC transporter substrate-binding protein [Cyanobacteria bacterium J06641_5]